MKIAKRAAAVILAVMMMLSCMTFAGAADNRIPTVRVNGYVVDFPDGKPFIDANSRTMIPVRFVGEQLGADVSWDNDTRTATVEKNGIRVDIPIGSNELRVTEDGVTHTVTMDTAAVISEDRTCVPIRFVAEALGAYVDYSDCYNVVGIYNDVLTKEQIEWLQSFDFTEGDDAITQGEYLTALHENYSASYTEEKFVDRYGSDKERASFLNQYSFANRREYGYTNYSWSRATRSYAGVVQDGFDNNDDFYAAVIDTAKKCMNYESDNVKFEFFTDSSCVYHPDNVEGFTFVVRGVILVTPKVQPFSSWSEPERKLFSKTGVSRLHIGGSYAMPIDIHMTTDASRSCVVNSYKPLLPVEDVIIAVPCTCDKCTELGQDWYMPWNQ